MTQIIKVTTTGDASLNQLLLRQTPGSKGRWGDNIFVINEEIPYCDWWFVCHSTALKHAETTICDPRHVVFVSMEPHEFRDPKFYQQFSKVIACDGRLKHPSITPLNAITWWAGIEVEFNNGHKFKPEPNYDYESLSALKIPEKLDRVSIITSNNQILPGHKKRLRFVDYLKSSKISNKVDIFGGGHNPVPDKIEALLPYKYHVALENSRIDNYWTEKIGDPFLGYALPFYYGCPNISKFFPAYSFIEIDIDDPIAGIDSIAIALERDQYSLSLAELIIARNKILNQYNIFNLMSEFAAENSTLEPKQVTLRPPHFFSSKQPSIVSRVMSNFKRTTRYLHSRLQ